MRRVLIAAVVGVLACAAAGFSADAPAVRVKAVDVRRGTLTVTGADGRHRELRLDRQTKVYDADGKELRDPARAAALQPGAAVLVDVRADGAVLAVRPAPAPGAHGEQPRNTPKAVRPDKDPPAARVKPATADEYAALLPGLAAEHKRQLDRDLQSMKALTDKHRSALEAAAKQHGLDPQAAVRETAAAYRAAGADLRTLADKGASLRAKYEPTIQRALESARLDPAAQRAELAAALRMTVPVDRDARTVALIAAPIRRPPASPPPPPPPPPPPDTTTRTLTAPFDAAGHLGDRATADARSGNLSLSFGAEGFQSEHRTAYILQAVPVDRGVRRVRVAVRIDPVAHYLWVTNFLGYGSVEAIVNLRVLERGRVVGQHRLSLNRLVSVLGGVLASDRTGGAEELHCEFTRANPDEPTSVVLVAELEGWAGTGGLATTWCAAAAHVGPFRVDFFRR